MYLSPCFTVGGKKHNFHPSGVLLHLFEHLFELTMNQEIADLRAEVAMLRDELVRITERMERLLKTMSTPERLFTESSFTTPVKAVFPPFPDLLSPDPQFKLAAAAVTSPQLCVSPGPGCTIDANLWWNEHQ